MKKVIISEFDKECYEKIRNNILCVSKEISKKYDKKGIIILDIAPQIHEGVAKFFNNAKVRTLDIDPTSGADFIADITKYNKQLKNQSFDIIFCTEVLEHTVNPFNAIKEIYRLLKPRGILILSTPFNFRIHGPLPDCWRFTEHGLRELLKNFSKIEISAVETPGRDLMPIHYTVNAIK
ncbi:class I SAM-dependent methyltransferase [Methanobacterium subterraneum]|jgi:ubiquinone/menaquinone biosynthesis C-methylase UbiE|uniref:Methyltransferase domain-containing protein n=1 Tax=Methanobacterium subterraneum TaxID=59277 RepID=A0A7K4DM86_9EURY|nr:class I SAM-dependent methyltransferase [Methanobacterium subterraneum]NMO09458.1 methyltransferase domain-containing protein [Methanobacterium subterraneum]